MMGKSIVTCTCHIRCMMPRPRAICAVHEEIARTPYKACDGSRSHSSQQRGKGLAAHPIFTVRHHIIQPLAV